MTRKFLNFGKMTNLIINADFREDSESGLGSKIGPTQPEIENMPCGKFITDPAVFLTVENPKRANPKSQKTFVRRNSR